MADNPHLHVEFYIDAQEDKNASRKEGRPIFKDAEMVRIKWAGDNKNVLVAPAHQPKGWVNGEQMTYAKQFPEHYRLFKANQDQQAVNGTPLSEVPWLSASKREELKALNVRTVEALAQLDGTLLQRLGIGARELKTQAEAWLAKAAGNVVEGRLAAELATRDDEIATLKEQVAQLLANRAPAAPAADTDIWASYGDEDIKAFIADRSGHRPVGNPKRETLIKQANEIIEADKLKAEAA